MKAAPTAVTDTMSASRRAVAALARAPAIPRRRAAEAPAPSRAAIILRRGMRPLEFRRIEDLLDRFSIVSLPIVPGQRKGSLTDAPVCGLIITGSDLDVSTIERDMIATAVADMAARGRPILAFTDGVDLVFEALGREPPRGEYQAVLVGAEDRVLTTTRQVEDAFKAMAKGGRA
jgi:hypothetical protein